jgi:hypothetical protein
MSNSWRCALGVAMGLPTAGLILAACFAGANDPPKTIDFKDVAPRSGEISHTAAVSSCVSFCRGLSMKLPTDKPRIVRWRNNDATFDWFLMFRDYKFYVEAATGSVRGFQNERRTYEQVKQLLPQVKPRIRSKDQAIAVLRSVAAKVGLRKGCKLLDVDIGGSGVKDANQASAVSGSFEYYYKGHPFHDGYGGMTVRLDPRDGVVCFLSRDLTRLRVETADPKLSFYEAKEFAKPIAVRYMLGVDRARQGSVIPAKASRLEFVRPNGMFGAVRYRLEESPARFRLAWVLNYPNAEQIWVDAGDGKVLGGSKRDL